MNEKQESVRLRDTAMFHIIKGAFYLLGRIPRKTAERIADLLGRIWYAFDHRHRDIAIANLETAFGNEMTPGQIRATAHRAFGNLIRIVFEIGWGLHIDGRDIRNYFRFNGIEHLLAARRKGKGVLILTAHIGNWELLIKAAGMIGLPMSAIYRPLDFKPLDMFFVEMRSRSGAALFPKERAMRKVMRSLKDNNCVGVLLDQNSRVWSGVFVDFFGKAACTNKGLALLARATGAPVVPLFLVREDGRFRVECRPELPLIKSGDKTKDIEANTRNYNREIEAIIRRYPEQWFWVHRRWRTRPYKPWPRVVRKKKYRKKLMTLFS